MVRPTAGRLRGAVYTDGSRLDGPTDVLARNGSVFVVLDEACEIVAHSKFSLCFSSVLLARTLKM